MRHPQNLITTFLYIDLRMKLISAPGVLPIIMSCIRHMQHSLTTYEPLQIRPPICCEREGIIYQMHEIPSHILYILHLMYQVYAVSLSHCVGPTQLILEIPPPLVNPRTHIYVKGRYIIAGDPNNLIDPQSYPKHLCPNV